MGNFYGNRTGIQSCKAVGLDESHTALGSVAQSSRTKVPERLNTHLLAHAQIFSFGFFFFLYPTQLC